MVERDKKYQIYFVRKLVSNNNFTAAYKHIALYKLDPKEFKDLNKVEMKNNARHLLGMNLNYDYKTEPEYMPLSQLEDITSGQPQMLLCLIEQLLEFEKPNEAKGMW